MVRKTSTKVVQFRSSRSESRRKKSSKTNFSKLLFFPSTDSPAKLESGRLLYSPVDDTERNAMGKMWELKNFQILRHHQ